MSIASIANYCLNFMTCHCLTLLLPSSPQNHAQNVRVCMNCAKITRERGALGECCADRGDALSWCTRIYEFTSLLG